MSYFKRVCLILASLGSMALFSACGNSATTCVVSTLNTASNPGSCPSGSIYSTAYSSCLQQTSQCSGNYGIYNYQCVPINAGNPAAGGNQSPFQGQCSYGLVQTSYGCLQQGQCALGYGFGYWSGTPYCFPSTATQ